MGKKWWSRNVMTSNCSWNSRACEMVDCNWILIKISKNWKHWRRSGSIFKRKNSDYYYRKLFRNSISAFNHFPHAPMNFSASMNKLQVTITTQKNGIQTKKKQLSPNQSYVFKITTTAKEIINWKHNCFNKRIIEKKTNALSTIL